MNDTELIAKLRGLLSEYMTAYPAFRAKPIGALHSAARRSYEIAVEREDRARAVMAFCRRGSGEKI
jgi:hypothetical protein